MMNASDVVAILQLLDAHGVQVFVDGGWGVDALLGEQTRPHADLDIAIQHKDVPSLRQLLESHGYQEMPRDDSWECNFVMTDEPGRLVDVHSYTFDAKDRCVFGVPYPVDSLSGSGIISGYQVKCISPEWMVHFHTGYELDMNDYRDVLALCERFKIEIPNDYDRFRAVTDM